MYTHTHTHKDTDTHAYTHIYIYIDAHTYAHTQLINKGIWKQLLYVLCLLYKIIITGL